MTTYLTTAAEIHQVLAPSSREALRLVRERLGPDAIIVSNRVTADGVEVMAIMQEPLARDNAPQPPAPLPGLPPSRPSPAIELQPWPAPAALNENNSVLREIHSMRGMIEEQLAGMAWNEHQRRDPVRGHLLRTLLGAGFSARLAKDVLENLPTGQSHACGMDYAKSELMRRLPMLEDEDALMDGGGVYALMGPTGVGKTTTTAKLAARCVMRFGAEKLALVTTDSYRIGAYEQLRIYGQILGVSVHAVKDAADLEQVLAGLRDKHMVLIDTVGMSQRDRAVSDQIAMLCGASRPVKRLLLLNASSHGDTLNEVVQAYRHSEKTAHASDLAGCIFTKMDEATHPGALIDMAILHQLPVHYVSSGQKVPEHLMLGDRAALIDNVFQAKSRSALFVPGEADLDEWSTPLVNQAEASAAQAVSEHLRLQCQQLIRALTHNAEELATNASALASGHIGFDETRSLWRKLSADLAQTDGGLLAQDLASRAAASSETHCSDCVLVMAGEMRLAARDGAGSLRLTSTLLLSDRTGLPFAAPYQLLAGAGEPRPSLGGGWAQQALGRPVVHLLACLPAPALIDQWQASGVQWAASGCSALRVVDASSGASATLAKLVAGLSFSQPEPINFRKKIALQSVAETRVKLRVDSKGGEIVSQELRCVVRRIVDAATGKPLSHSYVLASTGVSVGAQQMSQWTAWRNTAEPYFKLLKQGMAQLDVDGAQDASGRMTRLMIAAQASTTVFLLQGAQDDWADAARKALAQLAGRSVRPGRPVPGPVLFEGMDKLLVLLDAFETEGVATLPRSRMAEARV